MLHEGGIALGFKPQTHVTVVCKSLSQNIVVVFSSKLSSYMCDFDQL